MEILYFSIQTKYDFTDHGVNMSGLYKFNGNIISGGFWKDLHACRYIHKQNTPKLVVALRLSDEHDFVKDCMKNYGYTVLR